MNKVQKNAYDLIQSDARYFYTLLDMNKNNENFNENIWLINLPYIGIFTDGTEQWYKKIKNNDAPKFNDIEKEYYQKIRNSHKFFDKSYKECKQLLLNMLKIHDKHFYDIRSLIEKIIGYKNIGIQVYKKEFIGNTILYNGYIPDLDMYKIKEYGKFIESVSKICGKLIDYTGATKLPIYKHDKNIFIDDKDYHFYNKSPLKIKTDLGFILLNILCSINYAIIFVEKCFVEEIPQKLKFSYLQYYYLCDFIQEINKYNNTKFYIDSSLKNREFRNCLAHYGLGQYLKENEIMEDDILKGLTYKSFNMSYIECKNILFISLNSLATQIKNYIF